MNTNELLLSIKEKDLYMVKQNLEAMQKWIEKGGAANSSHIEAIELAIEYIALTSGELEPRKR